jgi:hypothetical protein
LRRKAEKIESSPSFPFTFDALRVCQRDGICEQASGDTAALRDSALLAPIVELEGLAAALFSRRIPRLRPSLLRMCSL